MDENPVLRAATAARLQAALRASVFALLILVLSAGLRPQPAHADEVAYAYDELGRLIQASNNTAGQAVVYTYDAVGNITSQTAVPLGTLSISYFSPIMVLPALRSP